MNPITPTTRDALKPKEYVLGFLFDADFKIVVVLTKNPTRHDQQWQKGLLNGIGGGIEPEDADPHAAMVREYKEETGRDVTDWTYYAKMHDDTFVVHCFAKMEQSPEISLSGLVTQEKVEQCLVSNILTGFRPAIENLPWLIALAIDSLKDGRPLFTEARYNAIATPEAQGWRGMESAPRDGTEVLVLFYETACCSATYRAFEGGGGGWYSDIGTSIALEPTHWQPLPPPPDAAQPVTASGGADAIERAIQRFEDKERGIPQAHLAAELVKEMRQALAAPADSQTGKGDK